MVTVAVVIATYRRPSEVLRCLKALRQQTVPPQEVIVVDSSPDVDTQQVVAQMAGVTYLRNDAGVGTTATSRAIAVAHTSCEVVAFLDDDSIPTPTWLASLVEPYQDLAVAAVGGRVINSEQEVEASDPTAIGRLLPDGRLTGNFAADPGHTISVEHLLGANMSYRVKAIHAVGGVRDYYPGTCAREDSDLGLRMSHAGMPVRFVPAAAVNHVSGAYAKGRRFDRRYQFFTQRNHVVLLSSVFGVTSPLLRRYLLTAVREIGSDLVTVGSGAGSPARRLRMFAGGAARSAAKAAGLAAGVWAAVSLRARRHSVRPEVA